METNTINRWLSLFANLSVVAGIIFLTIEIRQNSDLLEAEAGYLLSQNRSTMSALLMNSPEISDLAVKLRNGTELTDAEKLREQAIYSRMLINWEWEYGEYLAGRISERNLPAAPWTRTMNDRGLFPTPGMRDHWESRKSNFDDEFARFMDSLLRD